MDKPVTFAICGLGNRGLEAYAAFQKQLPEKMKITAGADPDPDRAPHCRRITACPPEAALPQAKSCWPSRALRM